MRLPDEAFESSSVSITVARLSSARISAHLSQRSLRCVRGSPAASREVCRFYGTVASSEPRKPPASAALPKGVQPTKNPWASAFDAPTQRTRSAPQFYVPSVLLPAEAARSPSVHKIHILGEDERSKFIAHALSGVYEEVELLGWKRSPSDYTNIQKVSRKTRYTEYVEKNAAKLQKSSPDDNSPIEHLVISARPHETSISLENYKHRINEDTTVCVMTEGLGVLDDVRTKIFNGTHKMPNLLLGHMSHKLVFNRTFQSVKQLKSGQLLMTPMPSLMLKPEEMERKIVKRNNFVENMTNARGLRSVVSEYDNWLRFKLPSVVFSAVAEPVCLLLDIPYQGLLQNSHAQRLMNQVLDEIISVLKCLPELQDSSAVANFINGKGVHRHLYNSIRGKHEAHSKLASQVHQGRPTDVQWLNGYFVRRAKEVGLDVPSNQFMLDMVLAKYEETKQRIQTDVEVEETSIPPELVHKYRSYRNR